MTSKIADHDILRMQQFITQMMDCGKNAGWQVNGWLWSKRILEKAQSICSSDETTVGAFPIACPTCGHVHTDEAGQRLRDKFSPPLKATETTGWQPIETAPAGRPLWLAGEGISVGHGVLHDGRWVYAEDFCGINNNFLGVYTPPYKFRFRDLHFVPKFWQKLPEAPKATAPRRADAPYVECDTCGRKSWFNPIAAGVCNMTQPSGNRCTGLWRLPLKASETPAIIEPCASIGHVEDWLAALKDVLGKEHSDDPATGDYEDECPVCVAMRDMRVAVERAAEKTSGRRDAD